MPSLRHAFFFALTFAPFAMTLSGCAGPLNNEPGIGNAGRPFGHSIYAPATIAEGLPAPQPPGLEPTTDQAAAPVYQAQSAVTPEKAQPSLTSLDRDSWGPTRVEVPNDFPAHHPRLARDYLDKSSDPRAQGRYPNERTALGTSTTRHNNEQFVEALVAPFVAAENVIMMVPRAVVEMRPRQPTRTGGEGYIRYPQQVTIVNPAAEMDGPAARIDPTAAPQKPAPRNTRPAPRQLPPQPPAEELRPGGGMPATDGPRGK